MRCIVDTAGHPYIPIAGYPRERELEGLPTYPQAENAPLTIFPRTVFVSLQQNEWEDLDYEDLGVAIREVPAHNFLAILGDFNARLGTGDAPFTHHNETNRNGRHLLELMTEHGLLAANIEFQKKRGKRWNFQDRCTGTKRQLDYILVRRKWRNSVPNAEPYSSFCSVGSDHRVVSMKVRLSLRAPKTNPRIVYDWKTFATDSEMQEKYTVEVRNRFQILEDGEDPSSRYQRFIEANMEATRTCVPRRKRFFNVYGLISQLEAMTKICQLNTIQD
ncbi:hypothetical protein CAPTEDRAFT_213183 [Capitella teleta]|uniref:Endonuclease/exonuclease/phosphatase domain-containing protein n=1 Tax=Capitella teleta TaxID=283909 RepID=R7VFY0_CAPTE|nr:hypothetical protein CAPTEDRAFT_213183 [Capitella teleta]|eukprot:ELU17539.1 hypothetical protein CAPTEDRAFT_213183 [Capitella teleta]